MDKKGILTVRMMGTISVEYEGEFFPIGTALTGKILQLFLILLYAGKKGVGREELLDAFYGNGEYANPSGSLRAAVFRLRRLLKEMLPEHEYICTDGGIYRWDEGNVTVSIDADLQDDINAVDRMIDAYYEGNDVVYGVRSSRKKDTCFKRGTAHLFYKLMSFLGADIVYDHADYRLLSKRATENLLDFDEVNLFLRGIVPMVGFQSTTVEYERGERFAGESKYPLGKMVTFAFEGITSLSVKPIRMITIGGLLICLISLIMLIKSFVDYFNGNVVPGWASIMVSIWVLGGLQIFAIGIIGEYIGKTYLETKKRPKYIIESVILDDKDISIDRNW